MSSWGNDTTSAGRLSINEAESVRQVALQVGGAAARDLVAVRLEREERRLAKLKDYYEKNVPLDSITIIEASTNSALVKGMLNDIGFRAEVVRSDVIADKQRKVCDINDARKLANAYIRGDIDTFVWTPSREYAEYRDILFAYRDAVKETTRTSNRIWAICCRYGYDFEIKAGETKADSIREMIKQLNITGFIKDRLEMLIKDYEYYLSRRDELETKIAEIVLESKAMLALMQLPGIFHVAAFATQVIVEDARRFPTASKLAAYGGYAMIGNTSGEEEKRAKKKGGTGKSLGGDGRRIRTRPTNVTRFIKVRRAHQSERGNIRTVAIRLFVYFSTFHSSSFSFCSTGLE